MKTRRGSFASLHAPGAEEKGGGAFGGLERGGGALHGGSDERAIEQDQQLAGEAVGIGDAGLVGEGGEGVADMVLVAGSHD